MQGSYRGILEKKEKLPRKTVQKFDEKQDFSEENWLNRGKYMINKNKVNTKYEINKCNKALPLT